jgi:hypothetical protein
MLTELQICENIEAKKVKVLLINVKHLLTLKLINFINLFGDDLLR